jgi:hypothetical protein
MELNMKNDNNVIREFLYNQAVKHEIYPKELEGESLAIQRMLAEIRNIGYPFHYFSDIALRSIKDCKIMEIMLKYYESMESIYTKAKILEKIDPKKFPIALDFALNEYRALSPLEKKEISGFQKVLSGGKINDEYVSMLLSIVDEPDNYASSFLIREKLLRIAPDQLKKYSLLYCRGVLLPATLKEFAQYADAESLEILVAAQSITEKYILQLKRCDSYKLCVTMYEYWASCCTENNVRSIAKKLLKSKGA